MSTRIAESEDGLILTEFYGGEGRGLCLQVGDGIENQYTVDEAGWLADKLGKWVKAKRAAE